MPSRNIRHDTVTSNFQIREDWGDEGHVIVAAITARKLTPNKHWPLAGAL
jgi:hypothetical protein